MLCSESFRFCEDRPKGGLEKRERLRKYSSGVRAAGIPKLWASWILPRSCHVRALRLLSSSDSHGAGWVRVLDSVPAGPCQAGHCRCTQGIEVNLVPPAPAQDHRGRSHRTLQVEHCRNMLNCSSSGTPSARKVWPSASFHGPEAEA